MFGRAYPHSPSSDRVNMRRRARGPRVRIALPPPESPVSASLFRGCTRKGPLSIEELGGTAPPGLARSDRDRGRLSSRDFRALALFRRRPPERVEGFVIAGIRKPAQKRTFQPLSPGGMAVKPA